MSSEVANQLPPLDSLKCRQCKNYLQDPITLQCLHSFCLDCLLSYNGATRNDLGDFLLSSGFVNDLVGISDMSIGGPPANNDGEQDVSKDGGGNEGGEEGEGIPEQETDMINEEDESDNSERHQDEREEGINDSEGEEKNGNEHEEEEEEEEEEEIEIPTVKILRCPTCTEDLELSPPEIPSEPFENERLARIVALVHDTPVLCQNCKESQSEFKCSTCEAYCCKPCWNKTHEAPIFKSHVAVPLRHDQMNAMPKCPQHSSNDLEFFVTEEEVGACQVCLLKGDFVGRPYSLVSDVRAERQKIIEEGLTDVSEARALVELGKSETVKTINSLHDNLGKTKSAVQKNFEEIRAALEAREKQTLEALQRLHDAKHRVLESQVTRMDRTMSQIDDGIKNVRLVLDYSNPLEVVYTTYVLQDHIATVGNVKSTAPKSCYECEVNNSPCHHPAVDEALPVVLSDRASQIVRSYAAVPDADIVERVALGEGSEDELNPVPSQEQQQLLADVASAAGNQEDWGCVVQ